MPAGKKDRGPFVCQQCHRPSRPLPGVAQGWVAQPTALGGGRAAAVLGEPWSRTVPQELGEVVISSGEQELSDR